MSEIRVTNIIGENGSNPVGLSTGFTVGPTSGTTGIGATISHQGHAQFAGVCTASSLTVSSGNATVSSGNVVIGTAGKGIDFSAQTATSTSGASTTAEILDHYEEGTWTPFFLNVNTPTYSHQTGTYVRIGRLVYCQGQITVASGLDTSDGSAVNISGLPFSGNSAHEACVFTLGRYTSLLPQSSLDSVSNIRFNGNMVMLYEGNDTNLSYSQCNSSGILQFAFTYQLA